MPKLQSLPPPAPGAATFLALLCLTIPGGARADWPSCAATDLTADRKSVV